MPDAVVIVDMVNGFLFGKADQLLVTTENVASLITNIQTMASKARQAQVPVLFIACKHEEDDVMFRYIPLHGIKGTWEAEIISDLTPEPGDVIVNKRFYDGFYGSRLDEVLRRLAVDSLYMAGIQTDCCVHATAQGAIFRGYRATIVADCCDTISPERQSVGLERYRDLIGPVLSLNEISFNA